MSHLVKQTNQAGVQIKDLDLLEKSCTKLGMTLDRNKKVAHYYGQSKAACDAVITIPGCTSEIAVMKRGDVYEIEADHFYGQVTKALGKNSDSLFQRYRAEELIRKAKKDNWNVASEVFNEKTQELELKFRR